MKIALLEPIGVSKEMIDAFGAKLGERGHEFAYYDTVTTDPEELKERSKDCGIVMVANHPYPDEVVEASEKLQMISVAFTGIDHIGTKACKEKGVMVCNAAGYSNETVAELILGFAVDALRNVAKGDQAVRNGGTSAGQAVRNGGTSAGIGGREICGRTVGIIGLGQIGTRTAELFQAFGAKVVAFNRSQSQKALDMGIEYWSLDEVLAESDIISLNLPLNEETRGFIDREKIGKMKKEAVFINCARGPIVDNQALADALNEDKLGFACVDVYDMEPPLPEDYPLLHAQESMERRAGIVFRNVLGYLEGKPENTCRL